MQENQPKSKRGGARPGSGRKKGSLNKATADIREAAQQFTDAALNVLASIMRESESDAARVAAANSILDRGHGKPRQSVEVDAEVKTAITAVEWRVVDPAASDA